MKNLWLTIGLIISVAANVFILGFFLGKEPKINETTVAASISTETLPQMKGLFKNLPPKNRNEIVATIKKQQLEVSQNYQEMLRTRLEIASVLQDENLDQARLAGLFEKMAQLSSQNMILSQQTTYQVLINLPYNERLKVAKFLTRSNARQKPKASPVF